MSIDIDKLEALARATEQQGSSTVAVRTWDALALVERLREAEAREQALAAHVEDMRMTLVDAKRCVAVVAYPSIYNVASYQSLAKRVMRRIEKTGRRQADPTKEGA